MQSLEALGWDARLEAAFAAHRDAGLEAGRVALEHTHLYRVLTASGEGLARVAGRLRHAAATRADYPAVGDWVGLKRDPHAGRFTIHVVLPRTSQFVRKVAGSRSVEQVVAANVDTVFLVAGLDGDFSLRRLERYLILAMESGARPVILLNKADLAADPAARLAETERVASGIPVHATSAKSGLGFDAIEAYLQPGRTLALLGSSGVGKSSIVNRLVGRDLIRTREVRESDSRGRHTTAHRQLVTLPGGALIIDTPGMRELQLWDVDEGFTEAFEDIEALAGGCRFRDCGHRAEPGCAVRAAVGEGRLDSGRLENYLKLQDELRAFEARAGERAQQEVKRKTKMLTRAMKKMQDERGR